MSFDANALTNAYIRIREARHTLKQEFEKADRELHAKQDRLEAEMLRVLQTNNMESIKTEAGTFYRQEEVTPRGDDWEELYKWIAEHDAFDALERRIKRTFVKEYMDANEGAVPPGVSVFREYVVRVRRS